MGKTQSDRIPSALPTSSPDSEAEQGGVGPSRWRSVGRALATLAAAAAVLLPAVFLLPPLWRHGGGGDRNRDPWFSDDIVASFRLQKPVDMLQANILKLQYDIYEEIGVPDSLVSVLSLDPIGGSNWTNVIFEISPYPERAVIPSTALSLLRSSFMSLVIRQSTLHLTTALFGNSSMFEVLKFPGGITIVPIQNAFLLQKPQTLFHFTLNFSIYQVQNKLNELKGQMESGLLLNPNENLYFRLTNLKGSTVSPPTIVQTSIVLAVGNHRPSLPRLKQLAQNIRNSSAGNLGLNHTVFGRVKQVQFSSFLQHSLNTSNSTGSPSPSPQPHPDHHHHHLHHHHHHRPNNMHFPPTPAPAPEKNVRTQTPHHCWNGYSTNPNRGLTPSPAASPKHMVAPNSSPKPSTPVETGSHSSMAPSNVQQRSAVPSSMPQVPVSSPVHDKPLAPGPKSLPPPPFSVVSFSHSRPPSESANEARPPDIMAIVSPAPYPSSDSAKYSVHWELLALWYVIMIL